MRRAMVEEFSSRNVLMWGWDGMEWFHLGKSLYNCLISELYFERIGRNGRSPLKIIL